MQQYRHSVAGEPVEIYRVEYEEDLAQFREFVRSNLRCLAVDTETTGLNIYQSEHRLRLAQFGTPRTAFVVPVELGGRFREDTERALRGLHSILFQNASYDLQVIERHLGIPMEDLWSKVTDTKILAHLVDSRSVAEGGTGHGLEDLTRSYLDSEIADSVKGLMAKIAKEYKTTKSKIWPLVDLDHPEYNLYAGMDTILTARIYRAVSPRVPASSQELIPFEHELAEICSYIERSGIKLDVAYTEQLAEELREKEEHYKSVAATYGVDKVNSTEQTADALEANGIRIKERTPTGKRKVDDTLLSKLSGQGDELADAIVKAKGYSKQRTSWVEKFLADRDENDRVHPGINPLKARTARMSITGIPAQTLPSDSWVIRRCFLADDGHVFTPVDYKAQELRVLAAQSGDRNMIQAYGEGEDLHLKTARAAFGDHIGRHDPERDYGKRGNFLKVYGGGAQKLSTSIGIELDKAKAVVKAIDSEYPGISRLSKRLAQQAESQGFITTPSGRRLYVDSERSYSALNYLIQSTGRDVTARAMIRLHRQGFTPYMKLPVHDEMLFSLPANHSEWGAQKVSEIMQEQMGPVLIDTEATIAKRSWGSKYGAEV